MVLRVMSAAVVSLFVGTAGAAAAGGSQHASRPDIPPNRAAPDSGWSQGHGTYCQQSVRTPAITEKDDVVADMTMFDPLHIGWLPTGTIVSETYPDGRYVFWGSHGTDVYKTVAGPEGLQVIWAPKSAGHVTPSGYWVFTKDGTMFTPDLSTGTIFAFRETDPRDPESPIALVRKRRFGPEIVGAFPGDYLRGMKLLYTGELLVTTAAGKAMVLSQQLDVLDVRDLGSPVDNNPCVDAANNLYITSAEALIKLHWDRKAKQLTEAWSVPTKFSGSTPTLMNAGKGVDRFVAITVNGAANDNQSNILGAGAEDRPATLTLFWRGRIPKSWKGLPGQHRRVAARYPITFDLPQGDPGTEPSNNSLLVSGNEIVLAPWNGTQGADDLYGRPRLGMEKVAWDRKQRRIVRRWLNKTVYTPNSMQALSTSSNRIYAQAIGPGPRGAYTKFGLTILDWDTGVEKRFVPMGDRLDIRLNNSGSGIQIGPDGSIITESPGGVFRFRRR